MGHPKEMLVGFQTEVVGYQGKERWLEMYSGSSARLLWQVMQSNDTHRLAFGRERIYLMDGRS